MHLASIQFDLNNIKKIFLIMNIFPTFFAIYTLCDKLQESRVLYGKYQIKYIGISYNP